MSEEIVDESALLVNILAKDEDGGLDPVRQSGRVVRVKLASPGDAAALASALRQPGVLEVLDVVGRIGGLGYEERRLASVLLGDDEL